MAEKKPERRGLGRGLSALMADVAPQEPVNETAGRPAAADRLVPVERIRPNPDQPRRQFTEDQMAELANSIREKGVIQPLILRPDPENGDMYEIVAGERRWRAAQTVQLHEVPALIREYSDTEVLEIAIIENVQRADLNAIEEAAGYRQLMDRFGHTQEQIAEALGKSRSHVANLLRLLTLPDDVQDMVKDGRLSAGHARALVSTDDPSALARRIVVRGLSVREAEQLAKPKPAATETKSRPPRRKDADTLALEGELSAALGMKVQIDHKADGESGQLSVSYGSLNDLDRLCNILSAVRE